MSNLNSENITCEHPIYQILQHCPNICNYECKKVMFYRKPGNCGKSFTRMCCNCSNLRQTRSNHELIVCHWMTSGNIVFAKCEFCGSTLDETRPLLECKECIFTYFERTLYEQKHGRDINQLGLFAFCNTHKKGIFA